MFNPRTALLGLALGLFHVTIVFAQQPPPWTGIAADEARPAAAGGFGSSEMVSRAMSADGRFVVFHSNLATLVPGDTNNQSDVFVRDRQTGELRRVSIATDGSEGNDYSAWGTISADGRHLAFNSCATNFDPDDTNNSCDLFIHDRVLGTTVRANLGIVGEQAGLTTQHVFNLSGDGRYFAFAASFDGGWPLQLWLRDRDTDGNGVFDEPGTAITTRLSEDYVGGDFIYQWDDVAISADGRWIAYAAATESATSGHIGTRMYLHDRVTLTTTRVDRPIGGTDTYAYAGNADFSESGHLVYSSSADNLTEGDQDFNADVFLFDVFTGGNVAVELTHPGAPALEFEWSPAISADGRYLTFTGASFDGWNQNYNVYVVDRQTGESYAISAWPDGTLDNRAGAPSISADGSAIAFAAGPEMLVYGFGNNGVFVATGVALSPSDITVPAIGGTFTIDVTMPAGIPWSLTASSTELEFSQTSGVGPASITVTVWSNYEEQEREFSILLGSEQVRLRQGVAPFIYFPYPSSGPPGGGTAIQIYGRGFVEGATVTFDGVPGTGVEVLGSDMINVVTPPHAIGVARLTVTNPSGDFYDYYFFYVDDTPPVVTSQLNGTLGQNGWYTSDVTVLWNYEDPETTVFLLQCDNPYVHMWDAASYPVLCHVMSEGGETTAQVEINRDTQPPVLALAPSEQETFSQGQVVPIMHNCYDQTSGIASCTLNQPGPNVDTSAVGTFELRLTAVDYAGHSATLASTYTVKMATQMTMPEATATYGGAPALLRASLVGPSGGVEGRTITFFIDNAAVGTAITGATGEAVFSLPLGGRGAGAYEMHAEFAGDATAFPSMMSSQFVVFKATPALTWANPAFIVEGTPLGSTQLNASASVAGAFLYNPSYWTVLPPGTHTLTANFSPQDSANYEAVVKTVTIKVKAIPVITWNTPAAITYPASLTGTQLNATANVAGSFVYTPAFGTLLDAGAQTLSVTFTPSNTADYVSESATTTIEVLKGTATITWPSINAITYGAMLTGLELNATASAGGSITYSPPYGTVLSAGTHTLTATFSPDYPYNYHPATATREIVVRKAYPVVYWLGDLAPIV
jgi:Tol biopolymer transport system component